MAFEECYRMLYDFVNKKVIEDRHLTMDLDELSGLFQEKETALRAFALETTNRYATIRSEYHRKANAIRIQLLTSLINRNWPAYRIFQELELVGVDI